MRTTLATLLAFLLFTIHLFAQGVYEVKGFAVDTGSNIKMFRAAVSILDAKDSTLISFVRTADDGAFLLNRLPAGKFILLITYPGYADYVEPFTINNQSYNFGNINIQSTEKILKEVLIKGEIRAIKINGDTTEFNAKAYVIQPNDKVEDLLKQLPGIQIDKNGKITANGEGVTKVLLDGEEFFGDDPKLVTKNIRADMVKTVQLYDKKSDQATFTGIDDGVKTKTINIVLKEDKKKGIFGKVTAGIGSGKYYEGQALYNKFTAREKYAIYFTDANDGLAGLGYDDQDKIGVSNVNLQIDGGITFSSISEDNDFQTNYDGNGFPLARTAGVHYDGKWDTNKQNLNSNFKIGSLEVTGDQSVISQQNLPGNKVLNSSQLQTFDNYGFKQKVDLTYTFKIDTSSNLRISADASQKNAHDKNNSFTAVTDGNGSPVNNVLESLDNSYNEKSYHIALLYTRKFNKGRTFSWNITQAYNQTNSQGYQASTTNYLKGGVTDSTNLINQYKPSTLSNLAIGSNMTFTQPLSKKMAVVFNYGFAISNSSADRETFNQTSPGNYNVLVDSLSSDYKFNQVANQLGAHINYRYSKIILTIGTKGSYNDFKQIDENTGYVLNRSFFLWSPDVNLNFRPNKSNTFLANYYGTPRIPSLDQLQPVASNINPTNIIVGNPNLKPSFNNRFQITLFSNKLVNQQSFIFSGLYSFTTDAIVNDIITNSAGKSITQYDNLTSNSPFNYSFWAKYSRKFTFIDANAGLYLGINGTTNYSLINNALDKSTITNITSKLNFSKSKLKKYNFNFQLGPGYSFNQFSLQPQINNNAPTFNVQSSGTLFLPGKFQLASDINYTYQGKTQSEVALESALWNASISKTFLKDDNLKLALAANNILNQNPTISRYVTANFITQSIYSTIQRYFMFSVTWDFNKFGTSPSDK